MARPIAVTAASCCKFRPGAGWSDSGSASFPWIAPSAAAVRTATAAESAATATAVQSATTAAAVSMCDSSAISAPVKRLSCPSIPSRSIWSNKRMVPYSPSYPGRRSTFPSRSLRIPSAVRRPETFRISSIGSSLKIANSEPSAESMSRYWFSTFRLAAECPVEAAITSGSGTRLSNAFAPGSTKPSSRSASCSTRWETPMVSFLPQTGHLPEYFSASRGLRQRWHFRWPS